MNKLQHKFIFVLLLGVCFITQGVYGQKEVKTYKETFNVGDDAILDINTSRTDIEFSTWDKKQVVVEATIEIEGATPEQAKAYFENVGVSIVGNSKKIEITTGTDNTWFFKHGVGGLHNNDYNINFFDMDNLTNSLHDQVWDLEEIELHTLPDFPELLELPPMPPMPKQNFNYQRFQKEGEAYLKKWQKEFSKGFNEEYEKKLEEWAKRMDKKKVQMEKRRKEQEVRRAKLLKERTEKRKELLEERKELLEERKEKRAILLKERRALRDSSRSLFHTRDSIRRYSPNIFYFSSDGENKNYKIKKSIKIKMPKSAKLKMNVRHGEVKLAANTRNMNANLSYATLKAATIDGDETSIVAAYSPVAVQKWNYGKLKADYSDKIILNEVNNLQLYVNSSDVTIDHLLKSAYVNNDLGLLTINAVSKNFENLNISVQNGKVVCQLPTVAYQISVDGNNSKLATPASLVLDRTKNYPRTFHKGYHLNSKSDKSIIINSKYSNVILNE